MSHLARSTVPAYLLVILFSSFGNTVIISIVKKNRRMRSPTNYFIVNLCLANLMIMLMNVVHYVVGRISPHKGYGISGRYLYISVWTRVRPPLFSSNINSLLSSNWANWDNREMVWKDAEAIFQWAFHGRCRCRIVRSPWHAQQHGIYLLNRSPVEKSFCYCTKLFGISNGF